MVSRDNTLLRDLFTDRFNLLNSLSNIIDEHQRKFRVRPDNVLS